MTSFFPENLFNTSFVDVITHYTSEVYTIIVGFVQLFSLLDAEPAIPLAKFYNSVSKFTLNFIEFDSFQDKILKVLLSTLICNLLLIFILWKFLGKQICERFMRPATSRAIEELKASVARLKLPKVHSPRI